MKEIFVAKIGSKTTDTLVSIFNDTKADVINNTKYMFCELPYDLIKNQTILYNITELINSIHKASKIDSHFSILFICYKDQQGNQENGLSRLIYTNNSVNQTTKGGKSDEASIKTEIQREWSQMLEYLNDMPQQTTVYMINLETMQYQLKIIDDNLIPKQAQTQLLNWLKQQNNLQIIKYDLQQTKDK